MANSAAWNLATAVGARRGVAKAGWNLAQFRPVLVLIETVGADQMELGSSSAQGVKRFDFEVKKEIPKCKCLYGKWK